MLAICALLVVLGDPPRPTVVPREVSYAEMSRDLFDPQWLLPESLPVDKDEGFGPAWDLVPTAKELATLVVEPSKADASAPRCLGDVAIAVRKAGGGKKAVESVLAALEKTQPKLFDELAPCLSELLCDDKLRAKKWDPDNDDPCDGIFFARPLTLERTKIKPWSKIGGSRLVQQACALINADFEAIKSAENDYRAYPKRPGSDYEAIYPLEDGFVRGVDDKKDPFSAVRIFFRCNLPFPFGHYDCDLRILNRTDEHGFYVCDIYSPCKDFLWMAGRDVFVPVRASDGTWAGTLLVRLFGFDLKGVPDGDDNRRAALRSSVGCLKRESEAAFARAGCKPRTIEGKTPEFEVVGKK